jgi:hypothetical protein
MEGAADQFAFFVEDANKIDQILDGYRLYKTCLWTYSKE